MPHDVWMVLDVCNVKIIEINKIKDLRLGPTFKKNTILNLCSAIPCNVFISCEKTCVGVAHFSYFETEIK